MEKNILYIIGWKLNHGGHINSTLNHIKYIDNKNNFFLIAPNGEKKQEFEKLGVKCFDMPKYFLLAIFKILFITLKYKIRIIHSLDYKALKKGLIIKLIVNKSLIFTKAGGVVPNYKIPPVDFIIVFSGELYDYFINNMTIKIPIELIKERIDTKLFQNNSHSSSPTVNVFMAMRMEPQKRKWLDNIVYQIKNNSNSLKNYKFNIAGSGSLFNEYLVQSNLINSRIGYEQVKLLGAIENLDEMNQHYNESDIIVGHGRGILEAMSCNKNVIILGENEEIENVNRNNIELISYFNFSGRHFKTYQDSNKSIINCLNTIGTLSNSNWNRDYIIKNYSAEIGSKKMELIYNNIKPKRSKFNIIKWFLKYE